MGCGASFDVYVTQPRDGDAQDLSGCFLGMCRVGRLKPRLTPRSASANAEKKAVVQPPCMFMHIDDHVKKEVYMRFTDLRKVMFTDAEGGGEHHFSKTPADVTKGVKALTSYLTQPCKSDLEKARAFYYWICNNIGYDPQFVFPQRENALDPASILRSGVAQSSEGYANLFSAFCRSVNIPVKKFKGYAKDTKYDPSEPYTPMHEPEHAWNAVYAGQDWRFVDCTWGSGFVDGEDTYHRRYEEFWFMVDPDNYINDHFPYLRNDPMSSDMWQLLRRPMSLDKYNKHVKTEAVTKDWGVEFSHREPIIVFRKELHIVVSTTVVPIMQITATLDTSDKVNMDAYVAVFRDAEDHCKVLVRPPSPGVYILKLAGKREGVQTPRVPGLVKYILKCTDINNMVKNFPFSYTHAQTYQACILEPTYRDLEPNSPVRFRVSSPFLSEVSVEDLALEKVDPYTWEGEILTPKKSGQYLMVYGSAAESMSEHRKRQQLYKFNIL